MTGSFILLKDHLFALIEIPLKVSLEDIFSLSENQT